MAVLVHFHQNKALEMWAKAPSIKMHCAILINAYKQTTWQSFRHMERQFARAKMTFRCPVNSCVYINNEYKRTKKIIYFDDVT